MENNQNPTDKKTKRPRIGEPRPAGSSEGMPHSAEGSESSSSHQSSYQPRQYQPRYSSNQPGQDRPQGGYQPRYNQGGYQPRNKNKNAGEK
ncbi:MAG: hypothetical protein K1V71_02895, partial [Paramuribaculum sp.]